MQRARILYLSDAPDDLVQSLHMTPIHSIEEGLSLVRRILGKENPTVAVIPDGVSVMVTA